MPGRILTVMLIVMGAFCCPFNCLHHQADSAAFFAGTQVDGEHVVPPTPWAEQNETGCICRGAFFVEAPTVTPIEQMRWCPILQDSAPLMLTAELDSPGEFLSPDELAWHPPISGRAMRALHSSFLF